MHDLGLWDNTSTTPTLAPNVQFTATHNIDALESGVSTPFEEANVTVVKGHSSSVKEPEAENLIDITQTGADINVSGDETLLYIASRDLNSPIEVTTTAILVDEPLTEVSEVPEDDPVHDLSSLSADSELDIPAADTETQVEESKLASTVDISAPSIYDANAPGSTRLRYMIKNLDHILVCPGVYDGLSARIALQVGFEGMYMTGAGTNASRLGIADLGIAHLHDMRTNAEMISNLNPDGPPVIADMDTGYGGPMVIDRSLQQYHLAGVAGFHIEDQVMQKRCGHLQGKEVVDMDTYISRIKACKAAAKRLRSDIVIIARTDALQSRGYDDCIERLRRARDEGADMGILEGFSSKEQARQAVQDMAPWPLCLNSVENGVSPLISVEEAQAMGFRVVIFSFASLSPAYTAIKQTFEWLMKHGVTGSSVSPKTIFECCGLRDLMIVDEQAGGHSFAKGV